MGYYQNIPFNKWLSDLLDKRVIIITPSTNALGYYNHVYFYLNLNLDVLKIKLIQIEIFHMVLFQIKKVKQINVYNLQLLEQFMKYILNIKYY